MKRNKTPSRMSWNSPQSIVVNQAMTSMSSDDDASSLNLTTTASGQTFGCSRRTCSRPAFGCFPHFGLPRILR